MKYDCYTCKMILIFDRFIEYPHNETVLRYCFPCAEKMIKAHQIETLNPKRGCPKCGANLYAKYRHINSTLICHACDWDEETK